MCQERETAGRAGPPPAHHVANTSPALEGDGYILARAGVSPGPGAARGTRGRGGAGGPGRKRPRRAPPAPRPRRKRLGFERCRRRRPPPAEPQRAEPAAALPSYPKSSTRRRGLPLPARLSRRRRRFLTRVPPSRGLGSSAAGDPEGTGLLGRGGGGVAVPPRPRPGSRLRLPPRKAGAAAAAASSFRFPLAPALGRSVLRGNRRPLRAPPRAPQGPTTARLLPREPRRLVSRGPLPHRPRGALPPPGGPPPPPRNVRAAGRGPARARLPVVRLARAWRHQRQFCSFPGSRDHPRPTHPRFPRPFPVLDPTGKPKQSGPRRREEGSGKSRKGGGRARCRGSSAEGGFPGKVSGGRVRGGGLPAPRPPDARA